MYVESGTITAWIGDKQLQLPAGTGVFINSKVLHSFHSPTEALIPNFVFMPTFIAPEGSFIYSNYVLPIISSSLCFLEFHREVPWQARALVLMKQIIAAQCSSCPELRTSALVQSLWLEICGNLDFSALEHPAELASASLARLQLMMHYIHLNYSRELSLGDIADHAMVSKSTALNLFQSYLKTTPVDYLIRFRLKQAALLLSKTQKKVYAIAAETGFHNVDYFCRTFKTHYHLTPTQYRTGKAEQNGVF